MSVRVAFSLTQLWQSPQYHMRYHTVLAQPLTTARVRACQLAAVCVRGVVRGFVLHICVKVVVTSDTRKKSSSHHTSLSSHKYLVITVGRTLSPGRIRAPLHPLSQIWKPSMPTSSAAVSPALEKSDLKFEPRCAESSLLHLEPTSRLKMPCNREKQGFHRMCCSGRPRASTTSPQLFVGHGYHLTDLLGVMSISSLVGSGYVTQNRCDPQNDRQANRHHSASTP